MGVEEACQFGDEGVSTILPRGENVSNKSVSLFDMAWPSNDLKIVEIEHLSFHDYSFSFNMHRE